MRESVVLGIAGKNGAGKDSFVSFLANIVFSPVGIHRFSDPLTEIAKAIGIEKTRENLQKLPIVLENEFGSCLLAEEIKKRVTEDASDLVIINGVRRQQDIKVLRSFPRNLLIFITAGKAIRYKRLLARGEKKGELDMQWNQFLAEDEAQTEIYIQKIREFADCVYKNEGTLDSLKLSAEHLYLEKLHAMGIK